ncbi:hypothetical protein IMSAG049_01454 [Clostridiales bacterium]|nr:hypothetical protein IMSAG049_01454 [Clostridiales bacterium]
MNKKDFAKYIGVKYITYNNYETDARETASDFLILISSKFDVFIGYILGVKSEKEVLHSYELKSYEYRHIEKYRELDPYGKDIVDTVLDKEYQRVKDIPTSIGKPNIGVCFEDNIYTNIKIFNRTARYNIWNIHITIILHLAGLLFQVTVNS